MRSLLCHQSKGRSPLTPFSQPRSIALLELVTKCDRLFGVVSAIVL
ncbi:hypothetical protein [Microcoleus sp.]